MLLSTRRKGSTWTRAVAVGLALGVSRDVRADEPQKHVPTDQPMLAQPQPQPPLAQPQLAEPQPQTLVVVQTTNGQSPPPPPVDDSPAAGWIVLGVVGIVGGVAMTGAAIGLFVEASNTTGSENVEATAGGVALIILGPVALAGGIGFVYWGAHPSKIPAINMNPFASAPDLVVGPRYAGVRWHF